MTALAELHCRPVQGEPLRADAVAERLQQLQGWLVVDGALEKGFEFADFSRTMAFVNAVAWVAQIEDHHPDLCISGNRCRLRWHTHSVAGLSLNDFICAAKVDALLS